MANRITVVLEALGFDGASKQVKGFRDSVAEADGVTGKFKAGASSAFDTLKSAAGPAALAAGAALVGFGIKAVSAFTDTALEADKLAKSLGTTIENGSRLAAVFKPLGIEAGDAQDVFNNLASMVNDGDAALAQFGVTVATAKDGTVDMNETFLRTIEAVGRIEDPARRAAAAAKFFGEEGARQFLPLIDQSAKLRDNLAGVSDQQVISEKELKKAEQMRDAQRAIDQAVDKVTLAVGGLVAELAPAIEDAAELVETMTALGNISLPGTGGEISLWTGPLSMVSKGMKDVTLEFEGAIPALLEHTAGVKGNSEATAAASDIVDDYLTAQENAKQASEDAAAAYQAEADALNGLVSAMRSSADANFALREEQDNFTDTVQGLNEKVKEAKGDQEELNRIYREAAMAGASVADATVRVYEETAKANGETLTATERLDVFNQSALQQAATLGGPARQALLDYIGQVNGIPPEKVSDILALINEGKIDEAKAALDEASAARDATITADAETSAAETALNNAARDRNVLFKGVPIFGSGRAFASGGPVSAGQVATVNDGGRLEAFVNSRGQQQIIVPEDGHIVSNPRVGGGASTYIDNRRTSVTQIFPNIAPNAAAQSLRRYNKRNGLG